MEKELLACIEEKNIKYLQSGQISKYIFPMDRKEAHLKKVSHLIIRFFVMALTSSGEILYLIQKRGKNKATYPNYFTDSASGHVIYQENMTLEHIKKNAFRELKEEFGLPEKAVQKMLFYDLNAEKENSITEVAYIFFGLVDPQIKLKPNAVELEIEGSKFYTKSELVKILQNENNVDYSMKIWEYLLKTDIKALFERKAKSNNTPENTTALFIGRMQPLHHGHIFLIYRILERHKKIKIGIGSSQLSHTKENPFTYEERAQFIEEAMKKRKITNFEIYIIPDIFNASKWVDHVISIVDGFDIIYSNSDWVRELFRNNGYKLGKKLVIFKNKYNGSNIRNLIIKENKNWKHLVPKEVAILIQKFNGIERIKNLYLKHDVE